MNVFYLQKESIMTKCEGCGALLQQENVEKLGYTKNKEGKLCERCFRIRHYGDYKRVIKDNQEFITILKNINDTKDLVLLVVDLFQMNQSFDLIKKELKNNPILLVLTKRDLLPKKVYDEKLIAYMDQFGLQEVDRLIISSNKSYHFDELFDKIHTYQKSQNVYVVGYTNAGKSTMMNQLIYHYSDLKQTITTSMLSSTTLEEIYVPIDSNLTLIDTPGILEEGSMIDVVEPTYLKKLLPKSEIRPITYQVKTPQTFLVDSILQIECQDNNDLTFYLSNSLPIERKHKTNISIPGLQKHVLEIKGNQDIVVTGLGFIKVKKKSIITLYTLPGVKVYLRKALI